MLQSPHSVNSWLVTPKAHRAWQLRKTKAWFDLCCTGLLIDLPQGRPGLGSLLVGSFCSGFEPEPSQEVKTRVPGANCHHQHCPESGQAGKMNSWFRCFPLKTFVFIPCHFCLPHARLKKIQPPWGPRATWSSSTQRHAKREGRNAVSLYCTCSFHIYMWSQFRITSKVVYFRKAL